MPIWLNVAILQFSANNMGIAGSIDFLPGGTRPGLISSCPSSDQNQTERVSKQRFLTSNFGRLLELMPVFLSGIRYDFR